MEVPVIRRVHAIAIMSFVTVATFLSPATGFAQLPPPPYSYGVAFEREASHRLRLSPGEHNLQLYLPGHRSVQQKIYLQPGGTFRVRYTMEALGPGEPAPERPVAASSAVATAPRGAAPRDNLPGSDTGTLALRVQPGDAIV